MMSRWKRLTVIIWLGAIALLIAVPPYRMLHDVRYAPIVNPPSTVRHLGTILLPGGAYQPTIHWLYLGFEILAVSVGGMTVYFFPVLRERFVGKPGFCRRCRYDLRHAQHDVCPECGTLVKDGMRE